MHWEHCMIFIWGCDGSSVDENLLFYYEMLNNMHGCYSMFCCKYLGVSPSWVTSWFFLAMLIFWEFTFMLNQTMFNLIKSRVQFFFNERLVGDFLKGISLV